MDKINYLRKKALDTQVCFDEFYYNFYKNFLNDTNPIKTERYADAYDTAFCALTPSISDGELIVGKCENNMSPDEVKEWQEKYLTPAKYEEEISGNGQDSHMAIDYELVLNCGLNGIIKKIDGYLSGCDKSKKVFYQTAKKCLLAVIKHSENYADTAAQQAEKTTDENRKKSF